MKNIILFLTLILLFSCSKNKTVMICGDHVCVNNNEANQYFEENLALEVKILDKKNEQIDLVQLNLENKDLNDKKVFIEKKSETNKEVKPLSDEEIKKIKSNVKKKNSLKKIKKKKLNNDNIKKKREFDVQKNVSNQNIDVCKIIEKCNIEEISKYLIKEGKNKSFPNIAVKQ
tara:strand:- start:87 stop:605 length:519 start_codon:yes stop_codon:yes gene_type:complete